MSTEEISSLVALKLSYCSPVNMETEINANKSKNSSSNEQKMAQDLTGTTLPGTHNENDEPSSNESIDEKPKEMELHSSHCSPKPLEFEFSDDLTPASDEVDTGETDIDGLSLSGPKPKNKLLPRQPPPLRSRHKIEKYLIDNRYYDMTNKKRGIALILNHFEFKSMKARTGTHADEARLRNTLERLDFEIIVKNDLKYADVKKQLENVAKMNHSDNDCFVTVIMTHGEKNLLWAKDKKYPVEELYEPFYGDKCPSLIGKPKLFFIQACRGDKISNAVRYSARDSVDSFTNAEPVTYSIPTMADLLVMYSTYEGHYSWRNPDNGSWFVQALCVELDLNGKTDNLLTTLTAVTRRVAYDFESNVPGNERMHAKKQMPSIVSMLTKIMYFTKK